MRKTMLSAIIALAICQPAFAFQSRNECIKAAGDLSELSDLVKDALRDLTIQLAGTDMQGLEKRDDETYTEHTARMRKAPIAVFNAASVEANTAIHEAIGAVTEACALMR